MPDYQGSLSDFKASIDGGNEYYPPNVDKKWERIAYDVSGGITRIPYDIARGVKSAATSDVVRNVSGAIARFPYDIANVVVDVVTPNKKAVKKQSKSSASKKR